jgi:hypothetical protein
MLSGGLLESIQISGLWLGTWHVVDTLQILVT